MPAVSGCVDLDLGFTPATNLIAIRRLALSVGASAEVTAAWLDFRAQKLTPPPDLSPRLDRRVCCTVLPISASAPRCVDEHGFVRRYPPLWEEA